MAIATRAEVDAVRARVDRIGEQARLDQGFKKRIQADPVGVLRTEGIPDAAIGQILRERGHAQIEVVGHEGCWWSEPPHERCWFTDEPPGGWEW